MSRSLDDITEEIENTTHELSLTPDDHPNQPRLLVGLGTSHMELFERIGELDHIDKAITYMSTALALTPDDHPGLPDLLETLGKYHGMQFQHLGYLNDLQKQVEYYSLALTLTPEGHPNLSSRLINLALSHQTHFERLGELDDIEKAIDYNSRALSLTPNDHPDLPNRLANLGEAHKARFMRLGDLNDIEKAIEYASCTLALTPEGYPNLSTRLISLAGSHQVRFERLRELTDIEKSIEYGSRALALSPKDHPGLFIQLSNLGEAHGIRFEHLRELNDIEKAIEYHSRALLLIPDSHPHMPRRLADLGSSYANRFQLLSELDDLKKAIECQTRALAATPDMHPALSSQHHSLAVLLFDQSQHTGDSSHLQASLEHFRKASQLPGSPRSKFTNAIHWATLASKHGAFNCIEAYQTTIDLLPEFIWFGATITQRYQDLLTAETLAIDAAGAAIRSSNYTLALEWVERTRSVVWNQSLMLRSPLGKLDSSYPELAARLQIVSRALHSAGSESRELRAVSSNPRRAEQAAQNRRRLAEEYRHLLTQARTLPGFQDLLLPMKANDLVRAARYGPIVVINCQMNACDALLILPGQESIKHVHLPNFTGEKAQHARSEIETLFRSVKLRERGVEGPQEPGHKDVFGMVLALLWNGIVKPILDFLGYTQNVQKDNLPHITWCPTGTLSFLPLHAAGDYDQPRSRIFDYVVSSFTPTLTALLSTVPNSLNPDSRILAIGLEYTPGHNPLPGVTEELTSLQGHVHNVVKYSQLLNDQANISAVLDGMERHDWVHLACHAHQSVEDPTKSGFFLHDGTLDLATISHRSLKSKGLAFLSACQTATGDEKLPDEAINLASGMLMAGYSSVIATMWSVVDDDAPLVADKVYAQLMKEGMVGNGEAGIALHNAVAELREKVGEKAFERWVPYIHIGS
ncbi:hypothetical protein OPQ81_002163 [Rhizoctonia solani]|nr:hypothetical protein OPQ81_002163 [Rhizoctonia solani]